MKKNMFFAALKVQSHKKNDNLKFKFNIYSLLWSFIVCDDEEILVGDACVYNSKSTGDIQTKPECEPYKNSYSEHPFILPDASAVYSKAAYLLQTKVLIL